MSEKKEETVVKTRKTTKVLIGVWIIVIALAGVFYKLNQDTKIINTINITKKSKAKEIKGKVELVKFYLPNEDKRGLKSTEEEIPMFYKKRDKAYTISNKYFEKLEEMNLLKDRVDIKSIYNANGIVYLDCSKELEEINSPTRVNILAIYGLLDTLREIKGVKGLKILIDNKEVNGNFSKVYERNIGM